MNTLACPLCHSSRHSALASYQQIGIKKYGCSLVQCQHCGHFFTKTSGTADLGELYENDQYELLDTRRSTFGRLIALDVRAVLRQLRRVKPPRKGLSILDFGSGKGVFLHYAAEQGWQVTGVETASKRAAFSRANYGLNVITDEYVDGAILSGPFDVITLFHVLEHLPNPSDLLKKLIEQNLKPDGVLVIEVPRFDSLQSALGGKAWIHLDPPRHLSHFSTEVLLRMLHDLGFRVLARNQFSIHNGLLGMVQAILSRLKYKKMLIEELKLRRSVPLLLFVLLVMPIALVLELVAILFGRGGIVRLYCSRISNVKDKGAVATLTGDV